MCHLEIFSPAALFSSNPRLWHKKSYHIFSCGGSSLDPREKEEKGHLCGLGGLRFACLTSSWSYLSGTFWDWYSKAQFESSHSCTKAAIFWFLPSVSSPMGRHTAFQLQTPNCGIHDEVFYHQAITHYDTRSGAKAEASMAAMRCVSYLCWFLPLSCYCYGTFTTDPIFSILAAQSVSYLLPTTAVLLRQVKLW